MRQTHTRFRLVVGAVAAALLLTACGGGADGDDERADADAPADSGEEETIRGESAPADRTALTLWTHAAGNPEEFAIIQSIIDGFNDSQDEWFVEHEAFPQGSYNDAVLAAALANNLPDILDVDGPIVPSWAWAGYLAPLELGDDLYDQYVDGAKGIYKDEVYALGFWDVTTGLFTRESILDEHGIRLATVDEPWTQQEFDDALETLVGSGDFDYGIDVGAAWDGEWASYAWSPWLQSFGGDLIDRSSYTAAEGVLNGPEAVAWGEYFQSLFTRGLAAPGQADPERSGFENGEIAIMYDGIWRGSIASETFDDLVFMPPPDFGNGPVTGVGSWQWAIAETSEHKDGARAYLEFAFNDDNVAEFARQIGLVPATAAALDLVPEYSASGEFGVFFDWADRFGLIRPPTPAYQVISSEFEKASFDIANGADVQRALDAAVDSIERDIEQNNGYGF